MHDTGSTFDTDLDDRTDRLGTLRFEAGLLLEDIGPSLAKVCAGLIVTMGCIAMVVGLAALGWGAAHGFGWSWAKDAFPLRPMVLAASFIVLAPQVSRLVLSPWLRGFAADPL